MKERIQPIVETSLKSWRSLLNSTSRWNLERWMESHPQNLSYFSPSIQNEMITILDKLVNESIKSEVISAKYFSIECDEVTSHKRAFMSVVIRYVHDFTIWERYASS